MARREPTRVVFDLLLNVGGGITKTQVVSQTNLNFYSATRYLNRLTSIGFLQLGPNAEHPVKYHLTTKGEHIARLLGEVYTLMEERDSHQPANVA